MKNKDGTAHYINLAEKKRKVRKMSVKKRGVTKSIRHSRCGPSSPVFGPFRLLALLTADGTSQPRRLLGLNWWRKISRDLSNCHTPREKASWHHHHHQLRAYRYIHTASARSLSLLSRTRILDTLLFSGTFFGLLLLLDGSATFGSVDRGYASICSAVAAAKYVCRLVGNLLTAPLFWWTDRFVL